MSALRLWERTKKYYIDILVVAAAFFSLLLVNIIFCETTLLSLMRRLQN
jgi:hypothetical protein